MPLTTEMSLLVCCSGDPDQKMSEIDFVQGLIFMVDEVYLPSGNATCRAHVLLPQDFLATNSPVLELFRQRRVHILDDANVSSLLSKLEKIYVIEIVLDRSTSACVDSLFIDAPNDHQITIQSLLGARVTFGLPLHRWTYGTMQLAVDDVNLQVIQRLVSRRADIRCCFSRNSSGSLLHLASLIGNVAFVNMLLDHGADVNATDGLNGHTPLHFGVIGGSSSVVEVLIERGADIHGKDVYGDTPLHYVKHPEVAEVLLKNGADVNFLDNSGNTPFVELINDNDSIQVDVAKVLLKYGSRLDAKLYCLSILEAVDRFSDLEVFQYLLESSFLDPLVLKDTSFYRNISSRTYGDRSVEIQKLFCSHLLRISCLYEQPVFDLEAIQAGWADETTSFIEFKSACEKEVSLLKLCTFPESTSVTWFYFLTTSRRKVSVLTKNGSLACLVDSNELIDQFLVYGRILSYRPEEGKNRSSFQEAAEKSLNSLFSRFNQLPQELKEIILEYLAVVDLVKLKMAGDLSPQE